MKSLFVAVCLACLLLALTSQAVYVQDGDYKIPLETMKQLKELLSSGYRKSSIITVCSHPALPKELISICKSEDAVGVFRRLMAAVSDPDLCEICAQAACAGC